MLRCSFSRSLNSVKFLKNIKNDFFNYHKIKKENELLTTKIKWQLITCGSILLSTQIAMTNDEIGFEFKNHLMSEYNDVELKKILELLENEIHSIKVQNVCDDFMNFNLSRYFKNNIDLFKIKEKLNLLANSEINLPYICKKRFSHKTEFSHLEMEEIFGHLQVILN